MNSEPKPNAQMPAGNARHAAGLLLEDWGLLDACTRALPCENNCRLACNNKTGEKFYFPVRITHFTKEYSEEYSDRSKLFLLFSVDLISGFAVINISHCRQNVDIIRRHPDRSLSRSRLA
jgi:hypothetical protein